MVISASQKLKKHDDVLVPLLSELRQVTIKFINGEVDVTELLKETQKLQEFRQFVNSSDNIGFYITMHDWRINSFHLSGDPEKDNGQINLNLPKKKMN